MPEIATDSIAINFGNLVSEMEAKHVNLCFIEKRFLLFRTATGQLYYVEPYYAGTYLDRLIREKKTVTFFHVDADPSNWDMEEWDVAEVTAFLTRQNLT